MATIAIIDDDIYIGDMLAELLQKNGYAVLRAYSGTEALYLLEHERPDLVLLDLMMPGLSGEEVLPHLTGVPVIILSAKSETKGKIDLLLPALPITSPSRSTTASFWRASLYSCARNQRAPAQCSQLAHCSWTRRRTA